MNYLFLSLILLLTSCSLSKDSTYLDKEPIKKTKTLSADLPDANFKKMSFNEFDQFLKKYSKNSDYPDINQ